MNEYPNMQSDQDSSNFVVPTEYRPGMDVISQILLNDKRIINVITETLVKAPRDFYVAEKLPSLNTPVSSVLYIPPCPSDNMPPIVVNTVEALENMAFSYILIQCTKVYDMTDILPICVVIVAQQLDGTIMEKSAVYQELPFFRDIVSTFWAKKCLLVSSKDNWMNRQQLNYHPLLDIIFKITSAKKAILSNDD